MASFLKKKNVTLSPKVYFVDAFGAMAMGLFASLLIATIFVTIYDYSKIDFFLKMKEFGYGAQGCAMAVAIGFSLKAPSLVLLSLCAVGFGATTVGAGAPFLAYVASLAACEAGKLVSKTTKLDIVITPTVTIAVGTAIIIWLGAPVSSAVTAFGKFIMDCTELQPFTMGILVSVLIGIALTLPISSAAICASIGLVGLAGGAATAGCCAQMVGFAVMSYRENGLGGLIAQGLGTSMLQMGNITRKPIIWLPPTIASAITGPVATCVFKMTNAVPVASGMGTCGLVGPIGVLSGGLDNFGIIGLILICFVLPCIITLAISETFRKLGWIKQGDLKLDL